MAGKWLLESPLLCLTSGWLCLVLLVALLAPMVGVDANQIHPQAGLLSPGYFPFVLGTDDLGRDLLSRLAVGARISLTIGLLTALVSTGLGAAYGLLAALAKGWLDALLMRTIDVLYGLPGLMVVILLGVFMEPVFLNLGTVWPWLQAAGVGRMISLVMALALFSWPDTARMVRAQVLALTQEEFVEAFHSLGGSGWRLVWFHLLPNLSGLLILSATITVPRAILTESTLSFIGLGVDPPMSSWGTLASDGWQLVRMAPHLLLLPAAFILLTMLALQLLGDRLQQRWQPTLRNRASA
ncbi:MAG: ABC transporter permease [Candidatus Melainabacteria bacterium]|nr:ABC transporter permease [Candidatus Melainabacteria bacterium]